MPEYYAFLVVEILRDTEGFLPSCFGLALHRAE